jgi:hypothetical protein
MMIRFPWNKPPEGKTVYWFEIEHLLAPYAHQGLPQACSDLSYLLPYDPAALIRRSGAHKLNPIPEKRDCNHFVDALRGWLAKKGWGVLCAHVRLWDHAVAGFVRGGRLELWDVQMVCRIDGEILGVWV